MQENSRIALGFCWANGPIAIPLTPNLPFLLAESFKILLVPEGKPILENLVCGHCMPSLCLPLGAQVFVDAEKGRISFPGK